MIVKVIIFLLIYNLVNIFLEKLLVKNIRFKINN